MTMFALMTSTHAIKDIVRYNLLTSWAQVKSSLGERSRQAAGGIAGGTAGATAIGAGAGAGVGAGDVPTGHLLQVEAQYPPAGAPAINMKLALQAPYVLCNQTYKVVPCTGSMREADITCLLQVSGLKTNNISLLYTAL